MRKFSMLSAFGLHNDASDDRLDVSRQLPSRTTTMAVISGVDPSVF
jgi:hypothetical protein